jgi:hypothetical protein
LDESTTFEQFSVLLAKLFKYDNLDFYIVQYIDTEGDLITISSTSELEAAIEHTKQTSPLNPILRLSLLPNPRITDRAQFTVTYSVSSSPPYELEVESDSSTAPNITIIPAESYNDHLISLSEATGFDCLNLCSQTTKLVTDICDKSISSDVPVDHLTSVADDINQQCSELSALTFQQCMNTVLEPIPSRNILSEDLSIKVTGLCEETREDCFRASNQITLSVLPLFDDIVGRCSQTSSECVNTLLQLQYTSIEGLSSTLQDSLIQSTVMNSVSVSDSILTSILSI